MEKVKTKGLGTAPVFLTAISTILGAVMFLRFGYSVGNVGLLGTVAIIALGHMVTIPTAMAIAEIATNQKVEGGGSYFIISRSFGITIGAAIGIALYFSEAISVAFYSIAFAEAFRPVYAFVNEAYGYSLSDPRLVSIPGVILLAVLVLSRGTKMSVKVLYFIVGILFLSLVMFFLGKTGYAPSGPMDLWTSRMSSPDSFFLVFAILFPAFTGVTAGVGLSGDLKKPRRSIPLGTLSAGIVGMVVYMAIAYKLAASASPADLASDQLIMSSIALWGPIIPIGLGCATFSSALGSILVAPRTLQALGHDGVFPGEGFNRWIAGGRNKTGEPHNGTLFTVAIALLFVSIGDVNFVARIISMIFMVTYGAVCLISILEHFAADPSYRPSFRSRWYISLLGAVSCIWLMFKMSPLYATMAISLMVGIYLVIARVHPEKQGVASLFQGAIFQVSRKLHIFLQKAHRSTEATWRPSMVCISKDSFHRLAAFELLRWISYRYGFGTYIHFIKGHFSRSSNEESKEVLERLLHLAGVSDSNVFVDTIISPSYTTAVAQLVQIPSISGKENNLILFEFAKDNVEDVEHIVENYRLAVAADFDVCVLAASERGYGYHKEIHIWITPEDYENVNLMILLGYIILGHPDWEDGLIHIFTMFPEEEVDERKEDLLIMVKEGRLPISTRNVETVPLVKGTDKRIHINEHSRDADLCIIGFRGEPLRREKANIFEGYDEVGTILFVNTLREIELERVIEDVPGVPEENGQEDIAEGESKREETAQNGENGETVDEVPEGEGDGEEIVKEKKKDG